MFIGGYGRLVSQLERIEDRLSRIEEHMVDLHRSSDNMDRHITFVENIFSVVKAPFTYLLRLYYKNDEKEIEHVEKVFKTIKQE